MIDGLDATTRETLDRFGFDDALFETLRRRVASGELSPASNVVDGDVEPPGEDDLTPLPDAGTKEHEEARDAGLELLRAGKVAQVVLAGGMATRFGGVVKAVLEVVDGLSFLEAKLAATRRLDDVHGVQIPIALMTSFATDEGVRRHVGERGLGDSLVFHQFVSLRLQPDGELFLDESRPSLYAPGHGDLFAALRQSRTLDTLRERGVTLANVSNVDNLGARVDPAIVGMHVLSGRPVTVEVARKEGDLGGAPVKVDGRLQLLEGPRFPAGFDVDRVPVFNTNTATFDLDALAGDYDLTWMYVEKRVGGRTAVQLERVYHEATRFLATTYLVVPRSGPRGRFFPIKTPDDLVAAQDDLRELLASSPG